MNEYVISAEYAAGFGWQFVIHRYGVPFGRYGSFDNEQQAIRAGHAYLREGGHLKTAAKLLA